MNPVLHTSNCHLLHLPNWLNCFNRLSRLFLTVFVLFLLSSESIQAQAPCNAHRWADGDGWRYVSGQWVPQTVSSGQPRGIVRCASSAETESGLEAFKAVYSKSTFDVGSGTLTQPLTGLPCFNQE